MRIGQKPVYSRSKAAPCEVWADEQRRTHDLLQIGSAGAEHLGAPCGKPGDPQFWMARVLSRASVTTDKRSYSSRNFKFEAEQTAAGQAPSHYRHGGRSGSGGTPAAYRRISRDCLSRRKKIAFVVRGEVFAALATEGGDAARAPIRRQRNRSGRSSDSRRLVYVSDRDGPTHLFFMTLPRILRRKSQEAALMTRRVFTRRQDACV
jgi:hypothetical protein